MTMQLRPGHTYRIYDSRRATVAIGSAYICDGSHRRPVVTVYIKGEYVACTGKTVRGTVRTVDLPLPLVRFRRCYRLRHIGGLALYRQWHRLVRRMCAAPR